MITTSPGGLADYEAASEMSQHAESIRQLGTHRQLVSQTEQREPDTRLTLDAIIVPASRPARNLEQAITLARAMHCALLILCSRQVEPDEVHQLLAERSFCDAIVVNLPDDYRHELLDFRALASMKDDLPDACSTYVTDLSTKRNVGLLLARMLGWRRIFFLDDDIRDINPIDVQSTVSMLGSFATRGHASQQLSRQFGRLPRKPGDRRTAGCLCHRGGSGRGLPEGYRILPRYLQRGLAILLRRCIAWTAGQLGM